jgi:CNT family concentrative nucleoside transporter
MSSAEFPTGNKVSQPHALRPISSDDKNVASPEMTTTREVPQSQHLIVAGDEADSSEVKSAFVKEEASVEKGDLTSSSRESDAPEPGSTRRFVKYFSKWKIFLQIFIWLLFTGYVKSHRLPVFFAADVFRWWIAGLVLHRYDYGWLIPFLLYLCITLRIIFNFVSVSHIMRPVRWTYDQTAMQVYHRIPPRYRVWSAAVMTLAVICVGSFVPEESIDNTRANRAVSIFGLLVFIAILWATSNDRNRIPWHTVIGGMLIQFIIAVFVLKTKAGYDIFNFISYLARAFLGYAEDGLRFLTSQDTVDLRYFITNVIPAIIFFIAVTQCLYHLGALQWLVVKFAHFFFWALRVSGAEAG